LYLLEALFIHEIRQLTLHPYYEEIIEDLPEQMDFQADVISNAPVWIIQPRRAIADFNELNLRRL